MLDDVEAQLRDHFVEARNALLTGRRVVFEVVGADLLGHGTPADAAVASALVGLARALALEGAGVGWSVNVLARGDEPAPDATLLADLGLSGQLLHCDRRHLGRVLS
jgi:hypothetical protein